MQPCARPIKIDTLNKKRLAVDASIWIYQFLKAVRDKEGNALRNSHVVGFFRRICKLLFFGIKPVFVFDGGAPVLKRQTISGRKSRREGRREDAVRTAGKLLAVQMHRRAEEEEQRRREEVERPQPREEEPLPENLVYVDELQLTQQERTENRRFKKKDQYHLPDLNVPLSEMGGGNDPRVMSLEELQEYAYQFDQGEDINVYDFSKIDFNSPFFTSLPPSDRYNILNAARLRSRLRMGYSRDQLESMFPDRMAFSRFQIERVRERNELTQRLMQVGTVEDGTFGLDGSGRVAGEKGREYVLVKNPGVEGGWALGVIGDRDREEGQRDKPIDIEKKVESAVQIEEEEQEEEEAGIEANVVHSDEIMRRRQVFYGSRKEQAKAPSKAPSVAPNFAETKNIENTDSLFVDQELRANEDQQLQKQIPVDEDEDSEDEETKLQIAIAMSMEGIADDNREAADQALDYSRGQRSDPHSTTNMLQPDTREQASARGFITQASDPDSNESSDDDGIALEEILDRHKRPNADSQSRPKGHALPGPITSMSSSAVNVMTSTGPLPFEKLDLGTSLLGRKKMKKIEEEAAGGFERSTEPEPSSKPADQAPPWFSNDVEEGYRAQKALTKEDRRKERQTDAEQIFQFESRSSLRQLDPSEPIDVDAIGSKQDHILTVDSDDAEAPMSRTAPDSASPVDDPKLRMGDIADKVRAEPPRDPTTEHRLFTGIKGRDSDKVGYTGHDLEDNDTVAEKVRVSQGHMAPSENESIQEVAGEASDELYEWEQSEHEQSGTDITHAQARPMGSASDNDGEQDVAASRSESPDVYMPSEDLLESLAAGKSSSSSEGTEIPILMTGTGDSVLPLERRDEEQEMYSDPEDEQLMEQMAIEAEEHARFASTLNNKTQVQNIEDYERELKALRSQQKKDRRDADEVTQIMISECQQLLKLFGLPYVTAPMEAEAQCAELVSLGLVDGIVTDDSDIFLFGGTRIYKNMFNQAKYVECYLTSDLERDFDLTRQKLIRVAHLLGSDYTEGLQGVGPVTALEILTEFPESLEDFKNWWTGVQQGSAASDEDKKSSFRNKFRKNATKLFLPPAFPDPRVDMAYEKPEVDSDPSDFQWGVPDLGSLRAFLMATIGWSQDRTDEVLVPVIKDMNRRENEGTQANITSFLGGSTGAGAFAPRARNEGKSRRMESALERMAERARKKRKTVRDSGDAPDDAVIAISGSLVDGSSGVARDAKEQQKPSAAKGMRSVAAVAEHGALEDAPAKTKTSSKSKRKKRMRTANG